jgi:hypothetical protein
VEVSAHYAPGHVLHDDADSRRSAQVSGPMNTHFAEILRLQKMITLIEE